jgi:hypothetical protein
MVLIQQCQSTLTLVWRVAAAEAHQVLAEQTLIPHETCEYALAYRISDKEAIYRRGDQFEKRRKLLEAWVGSCEPLATDNAVRLQRAESQGTGQAPYLLVFLIHGLAFLELILCHHRTEKFCPR